MVSTAPANAGDGEPQSGGTGALDGGAHRAANTCHGRRGMGARGLLVAKGGVG